MKQLFLKSSLNCLIHIFIGHIIIQLSCTHLAYKMFYIVGLFLAYYLLIGFLLYTKKFQLYKLYPYSQKTIRCIELLPALFCFISMILYQSSFITNTEININMTLVFFLSILIVITDLFFLIKVSYEDQL